MSGSLLTKEILFDRPKSLWPLQDGSFKDASVNGNHAALQSGHEHIPIKFPSIGAELMFLGDSEQIGTSPFSTVTNDFSFGCVYCPYVIAANDALIMYNGPSGTNGWGVTIDINRTIQFLAGGVAQGTNSTQVIPMGEPSLIVVVRRATVWEYWVNGVLIVANAGTNTPGTPSGSLFRVGSASVAAGYSHVFINETPLLPGRIRAYAEAMFASDKTIRYRANRSAYTTEDAATVLLDISVYEETTDDTIYFDLQASGTEFKETTDAATVMLDLSVLGGECYSTAQINAEADVNPIWVADTMTRFAPVTDNDINPQFVVADIIRSGVPC